MRAHTAASCLPFALTCCSANPWSNIATLAYSEALKPMTKLQRTHLQVPGANVNMKSAKYATNCPLVIMSTFIVTRVARTDGGADSEMYTGLATDAKPTPKPTTRRPGHETDLFQKPNLAFEQYQQGKLAVRQAGSLLRNLFPGESNQAGAHSLLAQMPSGEQEAGHVMALTTHLSCIIPPTQHSCEFGLLVER